MARPLLVSTLIAVLAASRSLAQETPPPAEPATPDLNKLLDELSKVNPDVLKAHLAALQATQQEAAGKAAKLRSDAAALIQQAEAAEAEASAIQRRIDLLKILVGPAAQAPPPPAPAPVAAAPPAQPPATPPPPTPAEPQVAMTETPPAAPEAAPAPPPAPAADAPTQTQEPKETEPAMTETPMVSGAAAPAPPPAPPAAPEMQAEAAPMPPAETSNAPMKLAETPAAAPAPPPAAPEQLAVALTNYTDHVLPIFVERCVGCHNQDEARSGLVIDNYDLIMMGGSSGEVIAAGDPDGSRLWRLINHEETPHMPPDQPKLPDETLAIVRKWIADGALLNAESKPKPAAAAPAPIEPAPPPVARSASEAPLPENAPLALAPAPIRPVAATALAASPAAPLVAVCGSNQLVIYHDSSHELLAALPFPEGRIERLQFSPDGEWLMAAGGTAERSGRVVIFDVRSGQRLFEIGRMYDAILAAACDPFRELVAYGGSNRIVRVFDTVTNQQAYDLRKHNDWIMAVAFSPDATLLATADRAGGLFVWEALTGRLVHELRGHDGAIHSLAFSPDSQTLLSAGDDGAVRMWSMDDGRKRKQFNAHGGAVLSLDVARDGRIVTSGSDGLVKLWQPDGQAVRTFDGLEDWAYSAVFAADGARIIAGDWRGNVDVFDCASGQRVQQYTTVPNSVPELALAQQR